MNEGPWPDFFPTCHGLGLLIDALWYVEPSFHDIGEILDSWSGWELHDCESVQ